MASAVDRDEMACLLPAPWAQVPLAGEKHYFCYGTTACLKNSGLFNLL